ncbi:sensor histidine kinase [Streptomyces tsukubensis]|uniref:Signal transduction histidine-protein kinase/phosphatase MprB n=1 Tax=Streptomyces tsukubensis TaxID=83656 RepID=A0A1V4AAL1_9ACTN|nr:HAMP domain-containing sensor histidine kinase [Streptomyces tsukubensis]OON80113.1 two-component sensor histidine kinase [Streptomyces tsukubensis]QFR97343.1 HAMP domain-containing protein [Streptomyces tsukubensis]
MRGKRRPEGPRATTPPRRPLSGLRTRLVLSFVLVAAASSLGTGALTFKEARTGVLQQSQDTVVNQFRRSVGTQIPGLPATPEQTSLDNLVVRLAQDHRAEGWRVLATYGKLSASSAPSSGSRELTPSLRKSVTSRAVAVFQRVRVGDRSVLVVGLPVTYTDDTYTTRTLSGLSLYLVVPQRTEQAYVNALITAVEHATVPALLLAAVLALLLARGVLRPVRALRGATRRMATGHLDTRLTVQGADELADLSRSFNDTAAALEESVAELRRMENRARRFAADVSHELRTPLAAMAAVTDVLVDEAPLLEGDTAAAVRLITEETVRLTRLVDDLMEISRFDAGAAELHLDDIDLAESLRRTLSARGWSAEVVTDLPDGIRARVDPRRLDVVVANLVGNALRHGRPPVTLTLRPVDGGPGGAESTERAGRPDQVTSLGHTKRTKRTERAAEPAGPGRADGANPTGRAGPADERYGPGRWVVIEVADCGPGIDRAALPHVFDRFYKASSARARSESSGLGLAITAENVHLHGGRVHAANRQNGGAILTVVLPAGLLEARDAEAGVRDEGGPE